MKALLKFPLALLASLLALSTGWAQDNQSLQTIWPRSLDQDEVKRLIEILKTTPEMPLRFENIEGAPLTITSATVKIAKRQSSDPATSTAAQADEYVMEEQIAITNNTDRRTKSVMLKFTSIAEGKAVDFYHRAEVEPYGSFLLGELKKKFGYSALPVDPSTFTVKIMQVQFEDGIIWEGHPSAPEQIDVDARPVLLMNPQVSYTSEARKNKIQGPVRMRLRVGADGEVKQVKVIRGLPDGLTEEAMKTAYTMKFTPAMKDGQPLEYWLLFEIDFMLR